MSLIESAVAVTIVGAALAAVTPSVLRVREIYLLRSAAEDVATTLQSAKIHAITRRGDCRFRVVSTDAYAVECQAAGLWRETARRSTPRDHTITANNRPEFHRRGNVSPTATITVWNRRGRAFRVVVNANGRVRIQ